MKDISATIISKNQITIPAEVRRHLGLKQGDKVAFVLGDGGTVELRALKYPSVASRAGAAGRLTKSLPLDFDEMLEIAREDALEHDFPPAR
ncbi:MAG TPA: AbrB/MazE/SpoVT family DNA-binding domain-containing protein [Nitrolancea sp.]|nr:AbrB/MazE/SpoVT family DNA-binding domain-containing protein [Nitrolancea sp.]